MKLQIIHTTDERLEGRTFEVDNPVISFGQVTLDDGTILRIDQTVERGDEYQYSNPNYVANARITDG